MFSAPCGSNLSKIFQFPSHISLKAILGRFLLERLAAQGRPWARRSAFSGAFVLLMLVTTPNGGRFSDGFICPFERTICPQMSALDDLCSTLLGLGTRDEWRHRSHEVAPLAGEANPASRSGLYAFDGKMRPREVENQGFPLARGARTSSAKGECACRGPSCRGEEKIKGPPALGRLNGAQPSFSLPRPVLGRCAVCRDTSDSGAAPGASNAASIPVMHRTQPSRAQFGFQGARRAIMMRPGRGLISTGQGQTAWCPSNDEKWHLY